MYYQTNLIESIVYEGLLENFTINTTTIGFDVPIRVFEQGKRFIWVRPDNFGELLFNYSVPIDPSNPSSGLQECNMPNCRLCRNGICELCLEEYLFDGTSCVECQYPNLIVYGVCEIPDITKSWTYPSPTLTTQLNSDLPAFTYPYFIRMKLSIMDERGNIRSFENTYKVADT